MALDTAITDLVADVLESVTLGGPDITGLGEPERYEIAILACLAAILDELQAQTALLTDIELNTNP